MYKEASQKTAYTDIIDRIRAIIHKGGLSRGDKLPPERKLAEDLGVSRNSLRRALQALAERNVLESRQGDGTYLLVDIDSALTGDTILEAMSTQRNLLHDILELRHIMEPEIAGLAALRATPATLSQLKITVCDQQRALLAGEEDRCFDKQFHQILAAMTGNSVIAQVMAAIQSIVDKSRAPWLQTHTRRQISVEGHLRIIDALERGERDEARQAMQQHIDAIGHQIFGGEQPA